MEMSALRHSVIRHLTSHQAPQLSRLQRRWARVHDVRFVATQQAQDRILERYRSKLDQKAKQYELGLPCPQVDAYAKLIMLL